VTVGGGRRAVGACQMNGDGGAVGGARNFVTSSTSQKKLAASVRALVFE
jgi:hypothetical protein